MNKQPVIRTDATGTETRYPSVKEAALSIGIGSSQITKACLFGRKCHGYYWRKES